MGKNEAEPFIDSDLLYRGAFKGDLTVLNIRWSVMKE
jgi:hypothetical protein